MVIGLSLLLGHACPRASGQERRGTPARKGAAASASTTAARDDRPLEGAWRLVGAFDPRSGQQRALPGGIEMTKLIVGGRFAWVVTQNGKAIAGAGGTWSMTPDAYSETVTYAVGANQQALVGSATKFTWKFEQGKWHHKGTLRVGQNTQGIDEFWERIPAGRP
jgi:hypothetical protein